MYTTRFMESGFHALATYDEDVDVTTGSAPGVTIAGDSLATWKEAVVPLRWKNTNVGQNAAWIGWNNHIAGKDTTRLGRPAAYAVTISDSIRGAWQIGNASALEFSLAPTEATPSKRAVAKDTTAKGKAAADSTKKADAAKKPEKTPKPPPHKPGPQDSLPIELSIEAIDAGGTAVRLPIARYGVARRPLNVTVMKRKGEDQSSFSSTAEMIPQTYVIPLADFRAKDAHFDPARLVTIRWVFDGTQAGSVVLTDIGLSNIAPAFILPEP